MPPFPPLPLPPGFFVSYLSEVTGLPVFNAVAQRASDAIEAARVRLGWAEKNDGNKQVRYTGIQWGSPCSAR